MILVALFIGFFIDGEFKAETFVKIIFGHGLSGLPAFLIIACSKIIRENFLWFLKSVIAALKELLTHLDNRLIV